MLHKLQYISQGALPEDHISNIKAALDAGIKLVQLRLKKTDDDLYAHLGTIAKQLCKQYGARLIINDNPAVAKNCNSDALHLGLKDMKVKDARKIYPDGWFGGTANTFDDVRMRCAENVDYIGLGPLRFTTTKEKLSPVLGIDGYKDIIEKMKAEKLSTPIYAIGGIDLVDIEQLMEAGVYGIAVSGLITRSNNKKELVEKINNILYHAQNS